MSDVAASCVNWPFTNQIYHCTLRHSFPLSQQIVSNGDSPIRTITVGCGTPVHSLSKLCQMAIQHLTSNDELPRNRKSSKDVLKGVININENHALLPPEATLALADAVGLYLTLMLSRAYSQSRGGWRTIPRTLVCPRRP